MRKSWVLLCLGTCALAMAASCSDASSSTSGSAGKTSDGSGGEAGQSTGGSGHAGTSAKAGSSGGGMAGTKATGGNAGTESGGVPSEAGQPSTGGQPNAGNFNGGNSSGGENNAGGLGGTINAGGDHPGGESSGGAAGAGGAPAPNCDDQDDKTVDFYNAVYGCGHETDTVPGGGDGWIWYDVGFYFDERTGAAWSPILTQLALDDATKYCDALVIGTLTDFKIPTIDQVRASFAGGCERTAPDGTCPIHDPDHLSSMEIYSNVCSSCLGSGTSRYCPDNTPFCSWLKTSSICSDCAGTKAWEYGPGNGNFAAIDAATSMTVSCVLPGLPSAMP